MSRLPPTVVYKLGGSLLSLPDVAERVRRVLHGETRPLLLVGGGATVDLVRGWDRQFTLGEERAHRLALRAMMLNESLLHELLPESRIVSHRDAAAAAWQERRIPILCTHRFLDDEEPRAADPLPHGWDVTSDSLAAWIALHWPADRLVLLKSVPPPVPLDRRQLVPPLVDACFGKLAPRLREVGWVDLRGDGVLRLVE